MESVERLRAAYIITTFSLGGATETVLLSVLGLRAIGYDAVVLAGPPIASEGGLVEEAARAGVDVRVIPTLRREIGPLADARALAAIIRELRRGEYQIVHTHSSKAGILGRLAARLVGVPVIVHTFHALPYLPSSSLIRRLPLVLTERVAARWTSELFSVSRDMIARGASDGIAPRERYRVVRSAMDLGRFLSPRPERDAIRARWGLEPTDVALGIIGRVYSNYKGQDVLVDLLPLLRERAPHLRLVIIGSGPLVEPLRERARRQGLADRVLFVGSFLPDDMPEVISALDALILISTHEGLPRVFVQALACRKPVISYDLDGSPEVITDRVNGRLIRPGDSDALVDAIAELASDATLRAAWGERGPATVDPEFRAETMVRQIDATYRRLLRQAGLPVPPEREVPPVTTWAQSADVRG